MTVDVASALLGAGTLAAGMFFGVLVLWLLRLLDDR